MNKQITYGYDDDLLTHQPRVVYDTIASESYNLYWNHFKGYEPFGEVEDHRLTNVDIADNEPDDSQARWYYPAIMRTTSMDPLCEKYYSTSPYAWCGNNPVNYVDLDGKDAICISFPKYVSHYKKYAARTGHAGILLIDNKTGYTRYYEYGRYDSENRGVVRNRTVPNVTIKDGKPTIESLNCVLSIISKKFGDNGDIEGAYIVSDKFEEMDTYAKEMMKNNNNEERKPYNILTNNCATFVEDVISQDDEIDRPVVVIHTPNNTIEEYQEEDYDRIFYNSETQTTIWK